MTTEEKDKQPAAQVPQPSAYKQAMQEYEAFPAFDSRKAYEEWKTGSKPILDALVGAYTPPQRKVTPEQEKKIRTASALTDGLTTLAEMFAHSRGAHVRPRQGKTSQQTTNERLRQIQEKYEQDLMRYNTARGEARAKDFSEYLRQAMAAHGQKRENLLYKTKQAWNVAQAEAKARSEAGKQAEQKRQFDTRHAETERSNRAREAINWKNADTKTTKETAKNIFEIPVAPGTQGAEHDPYTGKYYVKQQIPPERQISILSNLPGGKQQYIVNNRLYKVYNYKDDFGNMREQVTPFTDAEIIKHYLENDYVQRVAIPQPSSVRPQASPRQAWTPQAGTQTQNTGRFDHPPY